MSRQAWRAVRCGAARGCAALLAAAFGAAVRAPVSAQTPPASAAGAPAAASPVMSLAVDAREATRGILHVRESVTVTPGPLTLAYPQWIPGEHGPNGPIANLAGLEIRANGATVTWHRDPVDLYAFHVDVPAGTAKLDIRFDFLGAAVGHYTSARLAAPNMLVLTWNKVLLAPAVADYRTLAIAPSLQLPAAGWTFGTALTVAAQRGAIIAFNPVSEETLVDSPVDCGINARKIPLGSLNAAPVELDVFADTAAELAASDATIEKFRRLVAQMHALYGARHFDHYTFLLTVSDVLPGEGVEHHQSSDDGADGDFLTDPGALASEGDLLPHEFNHSWDGKYRRPADLATPNLHVPMQDDLLWVYEGMTQFYGNLQAERSGLWTAEQWQDDLAEIYAGLDNTGGRHTRPLLDTAVSAPFLYNAPAAWESARRGVDFYDEGALMWLEADITIRRLSHGQRSLDDFARTFFGRTDTAPQVVTYTRDDVIAALGAVEPYDWRTFFAQRVDAVTAHPPDPFAAAGWRVTYSATPNAFARLQDGRGKMVDARYSLGLRFGTDGSIADVVPGSPAARAGLAPGQKVVAIDGRSTEHDTQGQLDAALEAARRGPNMHLLVLGGEVYRDVGLDYRGGPRFAHLQRIAGAADLLSAVAAPRREH